MAIIVATVARDDDDDNDDDGDYHRTQADLKLWIHLIKLQTSSQIFHLLYHKFLDDNDFNSV